LDVVFKTDQVEKPNRSLRSVRFSSRLAGL